MKWPSYEDQEQCDLLRGVTDIAKKLKAERDRYRKAIDEALSWTSKDDLVTHEDAWISIKEIRDILAEALKEEDDGEM